MGSRAWPAGNRVYVPCGVSIVVMRYLGGYLSASPMLARVACGPRLYTIFVVIEVPCSPSEQERPVLPSEPVQGQGNSGVLVHLPMIAQNVTGITVEASSFD